MPSAELGLVGTSHVRQGDAKRVRYHRDTPQGIAEFFDKGGVVQWPFLHHVLAHDAQHFAGFLRESGCGVHEARFVAQGGINGPCRSLLINVELEWVAQL